MPVPVVPPPTPAESVYDRRHRRLESARLRFAPIAEILGDGPFACVSRCRPRSDVILVPTAERARWVWSQHTVCGTDCKAAHEIIDLDTGADVPMDGPTWGGPDGNQQ